MCEGGGNYLKGLKRGWNRTESKGHKDFLKRAGNLGQGVGALKRGPGTHLQTVTSKIEFLIKKCVVNNITFKNEIAIGHS